jgi:GxxExxY protein
MDKQVKPFVEEGYALMGAAFEVHNVLGGGMLEEIYQHSLEIELQSRQIPFRVKQKIKTYYKDQQLRKTYIPDLVVHEGIVVELKSVSELNRGHQATLLNYMRVARWTIGYLINFGPIGRLEYQRFILSEYCT